MHTYIHNNHACILNMYVPREVNTFLHLTDLRSEY